MIDREKVMDALRRCPVNKCDGCPYKETYDKYGYGCLNEVDMDALELLKEQAEQIERLEHDLAITIYKAYQRQARKGGKNADIQS